MELLLKNEILETISGIFTNIFVSIGTVLKYGNVISILIFAILLILIIYRTIRNRFTTEVQTYKAISKINEYLAKHPFITDENLVEFNRLIMKSPKTIRFQWQRYVINRSQKPSDFLSEENCITRPLRTNSYKQSLKNFKTSLWILTFFATILVFAQHGMNNITTNSASSLMLAMLIIPLMVLIVGYIYSLIGNVLYNAVMSDLYFSFSSFQKAIDRAVRNLPEAIDYEIIFTPKEIKNNIPALQEFLEQRALYDQQQLQKAKESEVEHETYNFDGLKAEQQLVLQRAFSESEYYLGNKKRLNEEIEIIQSEKASVTKDFEEENKNYQRNLRDIREEIASLKAKVETVTNEITRSSLRRQQSAEVEKEQNIEKEIEKATNKYNEKIGKLNAEIDKKRKEIEDGKSVAEKSLADEFKHFSEKTYEELKKVTENEMKEKIDNISKERNELAQTLEEKDKLMADKIALYEDKYNNYDNLAGELEENRVICDELKDQVSALNDDIEAKDQELFEIKQQLESKNRAILKRDNIIEGYKKNKTVEVYRYFDADGNEFYYDDDENPYYLDEDGNAVYYGSGEEENYDENEYYDENVDESVENDEEAGETITESEDDQEQSPAEEEVAESNENVEATENAVNTENVENAEQEERQAEENVDNSNENEEIESLDESKNQEAVNPKEDNEEESEENPSEFEVEKQETGEYKGIQYTLNELAKAAEEKLRQSEAKAKEKSEMKKAKRKSRKKNEKNDTKTEETLNSETLKEETKENIKEDTKEQAKKGKSKKENTKKGNKSSQKKKNKK